MPPPAISITGLVKEFRTAAGPFRALKGVDLTIAPGEFVGVVGKSGAGKTTLTNMITGVDRLTSGTVCVDGVDVHAMSENALARWRGQTVGVIFQSFQLMPTLSLLDNVLLPVDFCGRYNGRGTVERALNLLDSVGLSEHVHKHPSAISGGQQQRVAIARALANDPPILVADEPTGRLDSITAEAVFAVFEELVRQGKTILMVTHDRALANRMHRVVELTDGEITGEWKRGEA